ncbi:DNA-binding protein [Dyadobacter sp. CY261]|uniref:PPC domain-containing DNA-binding protein n=1 Tax=Dyadobacter sp. CY261 TaxID=2907203 RepID=UPI001F2FF740|nr:PPC domain-containing DNA-binding protein [Dyadobacter sp. CY261]MCF0071227.1 DNA-binding protein [Dyadobacter sp. CY261]
MHSFPLFLLTALSIFLMTAQSSAQQASQQRYTKIPAGYLMVLRQGDDVFAEIEKLAIKQKIPSATLAGMGFVNARFGFFNFKTKEYDPKEFEDVEMASMTGSIAWQDGKPSLHCHGVITGKDFRAYGGHLLGATVSTGSLEITFTVHDKLLERTMEQPLGANVLQLKD